MRWWAILLVAVVFLSGCRDTKQEDEQQKANALLRESVELARQACLRKGGVPIFDTTYEGYDKASQVILRSCDFSGLIYNR